MRPLTLATEDELSEAIARQGLGYNRHLCELVRSSWRPERAAERSPSSLRAMDRIRELVISWTRGLSPATLSATQALKAH